MPENKTWSVLNLGSGKIHDIKTLLNDCSNEFIVFVDRCYKDGIHHTLKEIEEAHLQFMLDPLNNSNIMYFAEDIFEFIDSYKYQFDCVVANRVAEHFFFDSGEIGRFLDACNQITTDQGELNIIVPNAKKLSELLLDFEKNYEKISSQEVDRIKLLVNSEFTNTKCDPHGSVWSPNLARSYIMAEGGTWFIHDISDVEYYRGRNIYMKIVCRKNKTD
jgi:hypothetical protein